MRVKSSLQMAFCGRFWSSVGNGTYSSRRHLELFTVPSVRTNLFIMGSEILLSEYPTERDFSFPVQYSPVASRHGRILSLPYTRLSVSYRIGSVFPIFCFVLRSIYVVSSRTILLTFCRGSWHCSVLIYLLGRTCQPIGSEYWTSFCTSTRYHGAWDLFMVASYFILYLLLCL